MVTKAKSIKGTRKFEIIKQKRWVHDSGCVPSRIILIKWFKHGSEEVREYSTHMECNRNNEQELYSGHYFPKLADAMKDFERREL